MRSVRGSRILSAAKKRGFFDGDQTRNVVTCHRSVTVGGTTKIVTSMKNVDLSIARNLGVDVGINETLARRPTVDASRVMGRSKRYLDIVLVFKMEGF